MEQTENMHRMTLFLRSVFIQDRAMQTCLISCLSRVTENGSKRLTQQTCPSVTLGTSLALQGRKKEARRISLSPRGYFRACGGARLDLISLLLRLLGGPSASSNGGTASPAGVCLSVCLQRMRPLNSATGSCAQMCLCQLHLRGNPATPPARPFLL